MPDADHPESQCSNGLLRFLDEKVVQRATTIAVLGVLDAAIASLGEMQVATRAGLEAREAPGTMEERLQALRQAKERLDRLRQSNARWPTVMNDGLADLVSRNSITSESAELLIRAVQDRRNILIAGGTGTGTSASV